MKPNDNPELLVGCLDEERLGAYARGLLTLPETSAVAAHLERCPRCLTALRSLDDNTDHLIDELKRNVPTADDGPCENPHLQRQLQAISGWTDTPTALTPAPVLNRDLGPGNVGPYELLEPLGEGGMGRVFKARHRYLGRVAAVKLLADRHLDDPIALARFQKEMQAIGQLSHPNVVQAFDANIEAVPYLAMEFIEGVDLSRLVKRRGPLPVPEACECVRQTALALQHIGELGLVHRDIKPSNLMLTPQGIVKLLDLGLAQVEGEVASHRPGGAGPAAGITRDDDVMGTMDYVAPEQILDSHAVDIRADLYSLGCTLYYLLTGHAVFADVERDKTKPQAHLMEPVPDVRTVRGDVPEELADILRQLLAKRPEQRLSMPAALALALHPFAAGAYLPGLFEGAVRPTRAARRAAAGGISPRPAVSGWGAAVPLPRNLWLMAVGMALLGVLAGSIYLSLRPPTAGTREEAGEPLATSLIKNMTVDHYRADGEEGRRGGRLGVHSFAAQLGDAVRVTAEFRKPAYCYLIAFRPDGTDQLCFPRTPAEAAAPRTVLSYPSEGVLSLQGKTGTYSFVLIASESPLPDYAVFRSSGSNPWPRVQLPPDGVWTYDGKNADQVPPPVKSLKPGQPSLFESMCQMLAHRLEGESMFAIAFPVEPRPEAKAPP